MKNLFCVEEDSHYYKGHANVMESIASPGMILIEVWMSEKATGQRDSAGIRLTREQAREMANKLYDLADELFFEEQRKNANE